MSKYAAVSPNQIADYNFAAAIPKALIIHRNIYRNRHTQEHVVNECIIDPIAGEVIFSQDHIDPYRLQCILAQYNANL
jgi:hypothetical protein